MIPLHLRIIREKNRIYSVLLKVFSIFTPHAPKVYLFHDILEDKLQVKTVFSISQPSFELFLLNQIEKGNKPLTFNQLSDVVLGNIKIKNGFYITFDDANESVFTHAYPFLKKHNIPFIIFITKELIGKPNFLNEKQIKILAQDTLCTVGSHALHHKMFRYFSDEESLTELTESKKYLEILIGKEVKSFAFPYGRVIECSRKNIRAVKNTDYDFAFSAISGNLGQKQVSGKFFLPRINVSENMGQRTSK